jgi:hypothetical protein
MLPATRPLTLARQAPARRVRRISHGQATLSSPARDSSGQPRRRSAARGLMFGRAAVRSRPGAVSVLRAAAGTAGWVAAELIASVMACCSGRGIPFSAHIGVRGLPVYRELPQSSQSCLRTPGHAAAAVAEPNAQRTAQNDVWLSLIDRSGSLRLAAASATERKPRLSAEDFRFARSLAADRLAGGPMRARFQRVTRDSAPAPRCPCDPGCSADRSPCQPIKRVAAQRLDVSRSRRAHSGECVASVASTKSA